MSKLNFGPLMTAVITPFDEDLQVDIRQFKTVITHLLATGTTALVVTGTTGEAPTLNALEKLKIWEAAMDYADGLVPVVAGVGTNNTKTTLDNIKIAEEVGVDALLIVVPYYNKPSQKGLLKHFTKIAEATELPIILYDVPARCGVGFELKTILELAKIPNIIGLKDSTGNTQMMTKLKEKLGDDFLLYSGDDAFYLETLKLGGAGVISVASHLVGKSMKRIYELHNIGFTERAECLNAKITPFYKAIFTYPNPAPIKSLLAKKGIAVGGVRLPLVGLETFEEELLWQKIEDLIDD